MGELLQERVHPRIRRSRTLRIGYYEYWWAEPTLRKPGYLIKMRFKFGEIRRVGSAHHGGCKNITRINDIGVHYAPGNDSDRRIIAGTRSP